MLDAGIPLFRPRARRRPLQYFMFWSSFPDWQLLYLNRAFSWSFLLLISAVLAGLGSVVTGAADGPHGATRAQPLPGCPERRGWLTVG